MLDIFVSEDKYINAKLIQQEMDKNFLVYRSIQFIVICIYLKI